MQSKIFSTCLCWGYQLSDAFLDLGSLPSIQNNSSVGPPQRGDQERECKGRLCRDKEDTMLPRATVSHAATKVPLSAAGIALSGLLYIYRPGIKNSFCGTWCSAGGGSFLCLAKLSFAPGHMVPPRAFSYQGIKQ